MNERMTIEEFKLELESELRDILHFWMRFAPDPVFGGFFGRIDNRNQVFPEASRGVLLYSQILWTFSAAFNRSLDKKLLRFAERAYEYIKFHFVDPEFGGVYWSVDHRGNKLDSKKQIYAQASCISALSEYYLAIKEQEILELAVGLYRLIEMHAYDQKGKGYLEGFGTNWSCTDDSRLNEQDLNEPKSLKTHLHLLESYTNLFSVWKNAGLRNQIENLLEVFAHHIVDDKTHHLYLYFDIEWNSKSEMISYGHELEAAWILQKAAEAIRHKGWTITMKSLALRIAEVACEGLDGKGGLYRESSHDQFVMEKHWWSQAEAMVGFYNAYQLCCEERWYNKSVASWNFIKSFIKDSVNGEWFWGVNENQEPIDEYCKADAWKSPYHNARACMELIRRMTFHPTPRNI